MIFLCVFCCLINIHDTESLRNIKLRWTYIIHFLYQLYTFTLAISNCVYKDTCRDQTVLRICVISGTNRRGSERNSVFTCICMGLTMSTLDSSGKAGQNTIEPIIISDTVYTGCGTIRQIPKSKPLFLFMTYWHKVHSICNGRFVPSSVDDVGWRDATGVMKTISINITISILKNTHPAMWLSLYWCWNYILCSPRQDVFRQINTPPPKLY